MENKKPTTFDFLDNLIGPQESTPFPGLPRPTCLGVPIYFIDEEIPQSDNGPNPYLKKSSQFIMMTRSEYEAQQNWLKEELLKTRKE
jgi:hypothetical protein